MFEDSLLSPSLAERNAVVRFSVLTAFLLQTAMAATVWLVALLHPLRLAVESLQPPVVVAPLARRQSPPVERVRAAATEHLASTQTALSPERPVAPHILPQPTALPPAEPVTTLAPLWPAASLGLPVSALAAPGSGPLVRLARPGGSPGSAPSTTDRRLRISSGVSAGLLLAPIRPAYPRLAIAARVEGTVVVEAVISRDGEILHAHVVSGPAMLAEAALAAVRGARYQPFHLNGVATEVDTTFSIKFRLGGAG